MVTFTLIHQHNKTNCLSVTATCGADINLLTTSGSSSRHDAWRKNGSLDDNDNVDALEDITTFHRTGVTENSTKCFFCLMYMCVCVCVFTAYLKLINKISV